VANEDGALISLTGWLAPAGNGIVVDITLRIGRRAFLGGSLVLLLRTPALAGPSATVYKDPT
jgi:hypothetical protein